MIVFLTRNYYLFVPYRYRTLDLRLSNQGYQQLLTSRSIPFNKNTLLVKNIQANRTGNCKPAEVQSHITVLYFLLM